MRNLGIKLPIIFDFEQYFSQVLFEKDRLIIHADYCFEENCKLQQKQTEVVGKIDQSNDQNVDYYDATAG